MSPLPGGQFARCHAPQTSRGLTLASVEDLLARGEEAPHRLQLRAALDDGHDAKEGPHSRNEERRECRKCLEQLESSPVKRREKRRGEDAAEELHLLKEGPFPRASPRKGLPRDEKNADRDQDRAKPQAEEDKKTQREEKSVGLLEAQQYNREPRWTGHDTPGESERDEVPHARPPPPKEPEAVVVSVVVPVPGAMRMPVRVNLRVRVAVALRVVWILRMVVRVAVFLRVAMVV
jgi:hypothetical protein